MTWKTVPLGDVARYIRGVTYKPGDVVPGDQGGLACLRTKNIQEELDLDGLVYLREDLRHRPDQRVQAGDILVSAANSWHLVGRAVHATDEASGMLIGGFIGGLRVDALKVDPRFAFWWFTSPPIRARVRAFGQQTTNIANLNVDRTMHLPFPIPSLPEQRRIAAILDEANALRAAAYRTVDLAPELEDALYEHTFYYPAQGSRSLLDIVAPYSGGTPSKSESRFWEGAIPWVSPKDMKQRNLFDAIDHVSEAATRETSLRVLPDDTVAIVVRGMILAHSFPVARLRVASTINQDMKALLPREPIDPAFLAASLRSQRQAVLSTVSVAGHGTRRLDIEALRAIRIPDVPYAVQCAFGSRVKEIEDQSVSLTARTSKLDGLVASLQHRAFRGEL